MLTIAARREHYGKNSGANRDAASPAGRGTVTCCAAADSVNCGFAGGVFDTDIAHGNRDWFQLMTGG